MLVKNFSEMQFWQFLCIYHKYIREMYGKDFAEGNYSSRTDAKIVIAWQLKWKRKRKENLRIHESISESTELTAIFHNVVFFLFAIKKYYPCGM